MATRAWATLTLAWAMATSAIFVPPFAFASSGLQPGSVRREPAWTAAFVFGRVEAGEYLTFLHLFPFLDSHFHHLPSNLGGDGHR